MSRKSSESTVEIPSFDPIRAGLQQIYSEINDPKFSCNQFVALYDLIYNFSTYKGSLNDSSHSSSFILYMELKNFLETFVTEKLAPPVQNTLSNPAEFFNAYQTSWDSYTRFTRIVDNVFQYLNRYIVEKGYEDGVQILSNEVVCLQAWQKKLFNTLFASVKEPFEEVLAGERYSKQLPANVALVAFIQSTIVMENQLDLGRDSATVELDFYRKTSENLYIESMKRFYADFYSHFLESNPFEAIVAVMNEMMDLEEERIQFYLHPSSTAAAKSVLYAVTLDKYSNELKQLLTNHVLNYNLPALNLFYKTICRYEGFMDQFISPIEIVLKECFGKYYLDASASKETVEHLAKLFFDTSLGMYNKYKVEMIEKAMNNDYSLATGADNALKYAFNKNSITTDSTQSSENLAKYSDLLLKKSSKPLEEGLNYRARISELICLFRYLEEKDVFQQHFSRYLSRRLINGTVESEELETEMINKLQEVCGIEFVAKFQKMISDNALGKELNSGFTGSSFYNQTDGYYQVLCMGTWPLSVAEQDQSFVPATQVSESFKQFYDYYVQRHSGRKLIWLPQYSRGEVQANFGSNSYTLQVSLYQATILSLFNGTDKLSFAEIQQATHLSVETLACVMEIFLKSKIFIGHQCSVDNFDSIKNGSFEINSSFTSKKVRINLNAPLRTEAKLDREKAIKSVEEDRTILIQAAIVRIMKAKKTLKHVNLVNETIQELQSKFVPQVADIKRSIETLIEREYLERSKESHDVLVYLA